MDNKVGLLGGKLSHSLSPQIHKLITGNEYGLFERSETEIEAFVKASPLTGYNVTVPYKQAVMPFLTEISPLAKNAGAVNTVVNRNGGHYGYNTDIYGFTALLKKYGINVTGKRVIVLGSGGASKGVKTALGELEAGEIITVSRTGAVNYGNVYDCKTAELIVNTTPVGMFPDSGLSPVDLSRFDRINNAVDLVYNPLNTAFLTEAKSNGIKAVNGLYMLVAQAVKSCELIYGEAYADDTTDTFYGKILNSFANTVLIGMPGCGKNTVGRILAGITGKTFIDTDEEIKKLYGKTPEKIILSLGEKSFRECESEVIRRISSLHGCVIATGGGTVTVESNMKLLKENADIIFIERDLSELSTDSRPLSQQKGVEELGRERLPLYRKYADFTVFNSNPTEAATKISELIRENLL